MLAVLFLGSQPRHSLEKVACLTLPSACTPLVHLVKGRAYLGPEILCLSSAQVRLRLLVQGPCFEYERGVQHSDAGQELYWHLQRACENIGFWVPFPGL